MLFYISFEMFVISLNKYFEQIMKLPFLGIKDLPCNVSQLIFFFILHIYYVLIYQMTYAKCEDFDSHKLF